MTSKSAFLRSVVPVLCWLASGCSSDAPEDPLKSAGGFCGEWAKNICVDSLVQDCGSTSAKCEAAQRDYCLDRVNEDEYTGRGAEDCLAYIHDAYRDQSLKRKERDAILYLGAPCDQLLSGRGKIGDACNDTTDCATVDDLECVKAFGETRGECQVPHLVSGGGRCSDADSVCVEGQYCNGKNCVAESAEGEICSDEVPCDQDTNCVIDTGETEGLCKAKNENGDACQTDDECASAVCDRNADEAEGLCVAALELGTRVDMCDSFR